MQLQMLLGLETHIAQGLGLLPYNKHSEIEICAEAVSALLLGVQQMQLMVKSSLLCTPDRLHKLCDARRSALFASLFQKSGILQESGNDLTIYECIFTSRCAGSPRPLRAARQCRRVSLPS